jgi:two-component system, chemotaxis family, chemotaxis protein CheV
MNENENNSSINTTDSNDELIRLVTSNADVTSQYVIFRNGFDELYAINVAKVEELIVNKDLTIALGSDTEATLMGVAKIRDNMCSIVHFDRWLGKGSADEGLYELIIVCNFGHQRLGIIIKNVIGIMNIEAERMIDNSARDPKTAQITEISVLGQNKLCLVFNSDALLADVFPESEQREFDKIETLTKLDLTKKLLFADDSKIVQKGVCMALEQMGIDFEVFDNGKLLLERLSVIDPNEVSLILSDIEMPVMDGMALLREVKANKATSSIPFIMNTNMANPSIIDQARRQGVDYVIHKLDVEDLQNQISKFARV